MKKIKVLAYWPHPMSGNEYRIEATIWPGSPAPPQDFARFQEPDDPDTIEINNVTLLGVPFGLDCFSDEEIKGIKSACFESAENLEPDYE